MNTISTAEMAYVINMPSRTLNHHVLNDGCPRVKPGSFDLVAVVHWYITCLQKQSDRAKETLTEAQRRQVAARAKMSELEYAKRRSEVILLTEHKRIVSELIHPARAMLLAMPSKVAPQIAHMDETEINEALTREIHDLLTDLSRGPEGAGVDREKNKAKAKPQRKIKHRG